MLECPSILQMVSIGTPSSSVTSEAKECRPCGRQGPGSACHQAQGFHIGPERVVVLRREKSLAGIVPVFLNQRDGFRKQLDTSEVVGFLSLVFQPEAALVIPEEVLPGDAYRIGIGGAGVTGEEEEVPGDDM